MELSDAITLGTLVHFRHFKPDVFDNSFEGQNIATSSDSYLAERVGFEPTIPFLTEYRFSRAGPSATRQPLRCFIHFIKMLSI